MAGLKGGRMRKANAWHLRTMLTMLLMHLALFPFVFRGQHSTGNLQLSGTLTAHIPARNWSGGGYQIIQNGQDLTYVIPGRARHNGRVPSGQ
jgi:hypothetical protein